MKKGIVQTIITKSPFLPCSSTGFFKRHRLLHPSSLFHSYSSLYSQFWTDPGVDLPLKCPWLLTCHHLFLYFHSSSISSGAAALTPTITCHRSRHQRMRLSHKFGERDVPWGRWHRKTSLEPWTGLKTDLRQFLSSSWVYLYSSLLQHGAFQ